MTDIANMEKQLWLAHEKIIRLEAENEKLKHATLLCPACGTDWEFDSPLRCGLDIVNETQKLRAENEELQETNNFITNERNTLMAEIEGYYATIGKLKVRLDKLRDALLSLEAGLKFPDVPATPGTVKCMLALAEDDELAGVGK